MKAVTNDVSLLRPLRQSGYALQQRVAPAREHTPRNPDSAARRRRCRVQLRVGEVQAAGAALPILNIFVPHTGQVPVVAIFLFFIS